MKKKVDLKQSLIAGAIAAGVAVVLNSVLFLVFHSTGIFSDSVMIEPGKPLDIMAVVMSSILPTLIGAFVFFLIEKYTENGFKNFMIVGGILFALMLLPPFMQLPAAPTAFKLALEVLHFGVFIPLLFFINRAVKSAQA